MSLETVLTVVYFIVALLPAIVLHELSHGLVADRFGDPTARSMGRLTLNPIAHIDPFGTVILPALLLLPRLFGQGGPVFGYAKPMPVNAGNLRDPDRQMMWIALWGPITNLGLAIVGALALRLSGGLEALAADGTLPGLADFFLFFVIVNVLLAVFNVLPLPPLDGSKVLARFLPPRARQVYRSWEPYGALFLLVIFFLFPNVIFSFINPIMDGVFELLVR